MSHHILSLLCLFAFAEFANARYQPPTLEPPVFDIGLLSLTTIERVELANELAVFAGNGDVTDAAHQQLASKALAIALRLDPMNRQATTANRHLTQAVQGTPVTTAHPGKAVANYLLSVGDKLKLGPEDAKLRAYLIDLAATVDGQNQGGHQVDWTPIVQPQTAPAVEETPADQARGFARAEAAVKTLLMRDGGNAALVSLKLSAQPRQEGQEGHGFAREDLRERLGPSLSNGLRAVRLRYPLLDPGTRLQGDLTAPFVPQSDDSAGGAMALLALSMLDNFAIDESVAFVGNVTADWKTRKVANFATRLDGLQGDCRHLLMPMANANQLGEQILLTGNSDFLHQTQIWGLRNLEDAIALARVDRPHKLTQAMAQFDKVQAYLKRRPGAHRKSRNLQNALRQILQLAPNHLSAKWLLLDARGRRPKTVSDASAIAATKRAAHRYARLLEAEDWDGNPQRDLSEETRQEAGEALAHLQRLSSPETKPLGQAYMTFINATHAYMRAHTARQNGEVIRDRPKRKRIGESFENLRKDGNRVSSYDRAASDFRETRDILRQQLQALEPAPANPAP